MLAMQTLAPNPGKSLTIPTSRGAYARYPIKTHVVMRGENLKSIVEQYAGPHMRSGDLLFISEKIVAISEGRAFPVADIKPSLLARFFVHFVQKTPHGIGLGSPWTMELAIREAGVARILLAALASALTKPFGMRGVFYRVVGHNINAIDGPCAYTLPPYNTYAKLGPKNPIQTAKELAAAFCLPVVIIDANDLGRVILGSSEPESEFTFFGELFKDNPLGQTSEQTPLALVRKVG